MSVFCKLCAIYLTSVICFGQVPTPMISFDKTHHDFGKISQDVKVSHRIMITNTGNATLQMTGIRTSCNCSDTTVGKWHLESGESTFIEIRFDPDGMMGNVYKTLELTSNDPLTPISVLTFEASVMREIMSSSTALFFHKVPRDGTAESNIFLQSGNEQEIIITDVSIPNAPYLSCKPRKEAINVILDVTLDGRLIPKQTQNGKETLIVRTTSKKVPVLRFHIQWDAEPVIMVTPNRIKWDEVVGNELRATVHLNNTSGRAFRILSIKSSSPLLKITRLDNASAIEHKFDVTLSSKTKQGGYHEKLTLTFDDPEQQMLEISVIAVLRNSI